MSKPRTYRLSDEKRRRSMVTPEGITLPVSLASRGSRFGALALDLLIIFFIYLAIILILGATGLSIFAGGDLENADPLLEALQVLFVVLTFLLFNGYFMFFEFGPRGATPGKRMLGIRIAARDGGRLTPEAVIARNLLRDIELFLPLVLMLGWLGESAMGESTGWASLAALAWFLLFAFFPFFNRDRLRAGDIIAGTWVVEMPKRKLEQAMSLGEAARGVSLATGTQYRFGDAELAVYGEYELQTLERVLREGNAEAQIAVAEAICRKIGWQSGSGDERAFLEAFYAELRARLERNMRFGKRKADKHS